MEDNGNRIDDLFRERLTNYEQKPDDQVWKRIADRMGSVRQKKLAYLFIRIAAGMTLLFSLGLGYYLFNRQGHDNLPSAISLQSGDKSDKDSLQRKKTKSQSNQPERKKSQKSDRLKPVRKVYKGPEILALDSFDQGIADYPADFELSTQGDRIGADRESEELLPARSREFFLLAAQLPLQLDYEPYANQSPSITESGLLPPGMDNFPPEDQEKNRQHEWILGGEVAPLYSYRTIASDYLNSSIMNSMNKSENGLLAYAGGIRIAYGAGKRLSVQSGLYYSRYGQEKSGVEAYTTSLNGSLTDRSAPTFISILNSTGNIEAGLNNKSENTKVVSNSTGSSADFNFGTGFPAINSGNVIPVLESDLSATQYFDYLELPLTVKYKIIDRKFGFSLLGGLVTNFLVNNGINLTKNGNTESIGKTSDINKINYLGSVGLGFEYPMVKNVAFSIEPRFRYYLNPIDQSSQISVHPYSFGIFAGISYGF